LLGVSYFLCISKKNKPLEKIEMNNSLTEKNTYPYVIRRVIAAVYQRIEVAFGTEKLHPPHKGIHILTKDHPYDMEGKPTSEAKNAMVEVLKEVTRTSGFRMCAVFGEQDTTYVEPDGQVNQSHEAPSGEISL